MSTNSDNEKKQGTPLIKCLTECDKGTELTVLSVNTGFRAKRRLAQMGLVPGAKIFKRKEAPFRGPLEIFVKGSSLVIGRGLASKIFVNCGSSCPY
jgi:DtxR family Mn-dependent transcriptional regulator